MRKNPFIVRCNCLSNDNPFVNKESEGLSDKNPFKSQFQDNNKKCNACGLQIKNGDDFHANKI